MMKTINLVFLLKVLFVIVPLWVQIRKKSLPVHLPRRARQGGPECKICSYLRDVGRVIHDFKVIIAEWMELLTCS